MSLCVAKGAYKLKASLLLLLVTGQEHGGKLDINLNLLFLF